MGYKKMLTDKYEICNGDFGLGKIQALGLATRNYQGAEAAPQKAAFFVHAFPYPYDTACMLDGFVPPVPLVSGLLNLTCGPFLFLARRERISFNFNTKEFVMDNPTATPTTITPYQYQPYSIDLLRIPNTDGTYTYRHPITKNEVDTNEVSLFDLLSISIEKIRMIIDLMTEDDYERFGFIFKAVLRDVESTYYETLHHIDFNIGDIYLTRICHDQFAYITDTVIDATIKNNEVR